MMKHILGCLCLAACMAVCKAPRIGAPMPGSMKAGDEVQLGLGRKGKRIAVYWWHGNGRLEKGFHPKSGHR